MTRTTAIAALLLLGGCALIDLGPVDAASGCAGGEPALAVVCEAADLVREEYVDSVSDEQLIDAALAGVAVLGTEGTGGELACDVRDRVAATVCERIDLVEVDVETGVEAALGSMAVGLDPNSAYLDAEALALVEEETSGEVEGIGALVGAEDEADDEGEACAVVSDTCRLVVVSTFPSSPARSAGLVPGDAIVAVDGEPVEGLHFDEVTARVRGPAGTDVSIGYVRDGTADEVEITRAAVEIPVVQFERFGATGYARLNIFTSSADGQLRPALEELIESGVERIVLDLRDNPGGTLQAAIQVTSEFLADGEVVVTESPDDRETYSVTGEGAATDPDIELVIAVNRGSASAAEVTAGVLQESGRATVVGESTFGKNTVQQRFPLSDGGALKLTVARWLTPGGADLGEGVTPDIPLDLPFDLTPAELVEQVDRAVG